MNWFYYNPFSDSYEDALSAMILLVDYVTGCPADSLQLRSSYDLCYKGEDSLFFEHGSYDRRYKGSYCNVIASIIDKADFSCRHACFGSLMSLHFMNKQMNENPIL